MVTIVCASLLIAAFLLILFGILFELTRGW